MNDNHDFETFARRRLDESLECMDAATRSRLRAARQRALAAGPASGRWRSWWLPTTALAMTAALAMLIWGVPPQPQPDVAVMEDLDLLASDVDLDLLDDVEFYQWLQATGHAG